MKRILAIETSSEACSVALGLGDEVLERHEHAPLRHAELLLPAVERLLAEAGQPLAELDAIAFGRGPGSFTSLRIGIGVVQGLAWAAGLGVVPCSSLAALALEAARVSGRERARVRVAVDARMQEVFTADFDWAGGALEPRGAERVCAPAAAAAPPDGETGALLAVGNGYARFAELQAAAGAADACYPDLWPRASMVLRLAQEWLRENEPLPAALAQPVYIRDDVAQKPGGK